MNIRNRIARDTVTSIARTFVFLAISSLIGRPYSARADESDAKLLEDAKQHFEPISTEQTSAKHPSSPKLVELGRQLFFDPRISVDGTVSCMRCHQAALFATDGLPKSHGARDFVLPRNAPTVFNTGLYFKEHWGGEIEDVETQARLALTGPAFGNADNTTAMRRIKAIPGYVEIFQGAFPGDKDPVTAENWGKAIGAFERTLLTPSKFDDYLRGKTDALSASERNGLRKFIEVGCADCHNGPGIGGNDLQKFGVFSDYWKETHSSKVDKGRAASTKKDDDLYVFKTAGLRNVEMTPPYFHDGSINSLPRAVQIMAKVQLDKTLSDDDASEIVAFLKSITGKVPESFGRAPLLPAAGFDPSLDHKRPQ